MLQLASWLPNTGHQIDNVPKIGTYCHNTAWFKIFVRNNLNATWLCKTYLKVALNASRSDTLGYNRQTTLYLKADTDLRRRLAIFTGNCHHLGIIQKVGISRFCPRTIRWSQRAVCCYWGKGIKCKQIISHYVWDAVDFRLRDKGLRLELCIAVHLLTLNL